MRTVSNQRGDVVRPAIRTRGLAFALWVTACHTWRPVQLAPTPGFHGNEGVRVVRSNGSKTELASPSIVDDSLVGHGRRSGTRVAIPMTEVRRVETRQFSTVRTVLLVAGVAVVVYVAVGAYVVSRIVLEIPP
jgi:hypothetical protein